MKIYHFSPRGPYGFGQIILKKWIMHGLDKKHTNWTIWPKLRKLIKHESHQNCKTRPSGKSTANLSVWGIQMNLIVRTKVSVSSSSDCISYTRVFAFERKHRAIMIQGCALSCHRMKFPSLAKNAPRCIAPAVKPKRTRETFAFVASSAPGCCIGCGECNSCWCTAGHSVWKVAVNRENSIIPRALHVC